MKFLIISPSSLISFLCGLAEHVSLLFVEGMWHHSRKLVSQEDNVMLLKWVTAHRTGETKGYWRGADFRQNISHRTIYKGTKRKRGETENHVKCKRRSGLPIIHMKEMQFLSILMVPFARSCTSPILFMQKASNTLFFSFWPSYIIA